MQQSGPTLNHRRAKEFTTARAASPGIAAHHRGLSTRHDPYGPQRPVNRKQTRLLTNRSYGEDYGGAVAPPIIGVNDSAATYAIANVSAILDLQR